MKHEEIRHKLSDYIDGSVTADEKAEIDDHIKSCPQCGNALEELQKTVGHIKGLEEVAPPAWMTQKIMAGIRTEGERKKSWIERMFFPLRIKLPLEALGVVFLAVTVYFIYQNEPRQAPVAEAPVQGLASRPETRQAVPQRDKADKRAESQAGPEKEVPQEPGYKALDMKHAYEAPPPPAPAPAPKSVAPVEESARKKDGHHREKMEGAPRTAAPQSMTDQAPAAEREAQAEAPSAMTGKKGGEMAGAGSADYSGNVGGAGLQEKFVLTVTVTEKTLGSEKVNEAIEQSQGSILKRETINNADTILVRISSSKFGDLVNTLKTLGRIEQKDLSKPRGDGTMEVEIRLVKEEQRK